MALGSFPEKFGLSFLVPAKPIASRGSAWGVCDMIFNEFPLRFPFSCPAKLTTVWFLIWQFCAIKPWLMCSLPHIPALLASKEFNILDTGKFIWQVNTGSFCSDSVTNASMGALITGPANEPRPVRGLIAPKRCSVPPFPLLKVLRIN